MSRLYWYGDRMVVDNSITYFVNLQPKSWSGGVICGMLLVFVVLSCLPVLQGCAFTKISVDC